MSVNKSLVLASSFWPSLAAPQSQNPRRSAATPVVLLNRPDQSVSKSDAIPEKLIYGQALRDAEITNVPVLSLRAKRGNPCPFKLQPWIATACGLAMTEIRYFRNFFIPNAYLREGRQTPEDKLFYHQRLLQNALLCFDRLSMNGRNYNDLKMATVRPEPVEGCFSIFARGSSWVTIPTPIPSSA